MPLNLAGGYGAGGGFDAMMELREALRREMADEALKEEAAARLGENRRQFDIKAPSEVKLTEAQTGDILDRPAAQDREFKNKLTILNTGNLFNADQNALDRTFKTNERIGSQTFQTGERLGGQQFQTGERLGGQSFRTSERLGTQTFTRGENAADRASRVNLMNLQNAGDMAAAQFRADIGRPVTGEQRLSRDFYTRMRSALDDMDAVEGELSAKDVAVLQSSPLPEAINNAMLSSAGQRYAQALRAYTLAKLRRESGAAISAGEFTKEGLVAARALGDTPETLAQKRRTREGVAEGFAASSGRAFDEYYGKPFERGAGGGVKRRVKVQSADGKQSGEVDEDEVNLLPAGWKVVGGR